MTVLGTGGTRCYKLCLSEEKLKERNERTCCGLTEPMVLINEKSIQVMHQLSPKMCSDN